MYNLPHLGGCSKQPRKTDYDSSPLGFETVMDKMPFAFYKVHVPVAISTFSEMCRDHGLPSAT